MKDIHVLYKGAASHVRGSNEYKNEFSVQVEIDQGSILSPFLFYIASKP